MYAALVFFIFLGKPLDPDCGTVSIVHVGNEWTRHGSAVSSKKGSVSYLKLEQPDGTSDFLFNSRFVEILNGLKCKPDLIFFSSCQSYQLAEDVTKHGGIKVAIGVSVSSTKSPLRRA